SLHRIVSRKVPLPDSLEGQLPRAPDSRSACDTSSGLQRFRLTRWDYSMRLAILVVAHHSVIPAQRTNALDGAQPDRWVTLHIQR
ncbi:MAG: hypothetical protein K0R13_3368, partial [Propionibacteriaceae bacterium]|nr:hypothetical protein [Propionibacteriaceae bacterium]